MIAFCRSDIKCLIRIRFAKLSHQDMESKYRIGNNWCALTLTSAMYSVVAAASSWGGVRQTMVREDVSMCTTRQDHRGTETSASHA